MADSRCVSVYQNRNVAGVALGPACRCTRPAGHAVDEPGVDVPLGDYHGMHHWLRVGRAVMWPDSAAEPAADGD